MFHRNILIFILKNFVEKMVINHKLYINIFTFIKIKSVILLNFILYKSIQRFHH